MSNSSGTREMMARALKEITIPFLQDNGFKGNYPNFYRDRNNHIDLLRFQFNKWGGSFVVEISYADRSRNNLTTAKDTEIPNISVTQTRERLRLGASQDDKDYWFKFNNRNIFFWRDKYVSTARKVNQYISNQALPWWQDKDSE